MQAIKCELCGSNEFTKVDGLFQCNHCNTKYTLEEAKKLIVSGTVEVVKGNAEKERLFSNAETCMKIGEFEKAKSFYEKMINTFPSDYRGWWGKYSIPFKRYINGENEPEDYENNVFYEEKLFFNALNLCPDKNKNEFIDIFKQVINIHGSKILIASNRSCRYYDVKNKTYSDMHGASCFTLWLVFESEKIFKPLNNEELILFSKDIVQQYIKDVNKGKIIPVNKTWTFSSLEFYPKEPYYNAWDTSTVLKSYIENNHYVELLFKKHGFKMTNDTHHCIEITNKNVSFPFYDAQKAPEFEVKAIIGHWAYIAFTYYDSVSREIFLFPDDISTPFIYKIENKCQYCGGEFKGLLKKSCSQCGKPKDY